MFNATGETAGEIWELLKNEGSCSISAIASNLKKPKDIVSMGIGWLAREDKITFIQTKRGVYVRLKE
ncbi:MAG: winged helix-turn-helix domain-containing protein [Dehalococcoidales bacterium]|nr:winged helix-turn-helix domain-containing protein [Dehalococcoidales bacterium]